MTPVQDEFSGCLLSVAVTTSGLIEGVRVFVDIALSNVSLQNQFNSSSVAMGMLIDLPKGNFLYGGLIEAKQDDADENDIQLVMSLNTSIVSDDIGVSIILQTLDSDGRTSLSRSIQLFGKPPLVYNAPLFINSSSLLISASSGYSPLLTISNTLSSLQCSDLPLISTKLNVTFLSPYQAILAWTLANLRSDLNFSGLIDISVTRCSVSQSMTILEDTCTDYSVAADGDMSTQLATTPFTAYMFQVVGGTTQSEVINVISPEAGEYDTIGYTCKY